MKIITTEEINSLSKRFRKALTKLELSQEEYYYLMNHDFEDDLIGTIRDIAITDKYFGHTLTTFNIRIPKNYNPLRHILEFSKLINDTNGYRDVITKDFFTKSTHQLISGKKYTLNFYPILIKLEDSDRMACINFLRKKKSLLVGPEGLAIAWGLAKQQFPRGKYIFSLDYMKKLLIDKKEIYSQPDICCTGSGEGYVNGSGFANKKSVNLSFSTECCLISFTEI